MRLRERLRGFRPSGSEPAWWVRDVVIALLIGGLLFAGQVVVDNRRSEREAEMASTLADEADRRENLRFVRERSSDEAVDRPFAHMDLRDQNLAELDMSGANLRHASLVGVELGGADLSGADLAGTTLIRANASNTNFSSADFNCRPWRREHQLCNTRLTGIIAFGANFNDADLTEVNMVHAWFTAATTFRGATLRDANLSGARLYGVDLSSTDLRGADIEGACYNSETIWPDGFDPPPPAPPESCN